MLGLCCCLGFSLVAVCRLLTAVASLVVEHGLHGVWASVVKACRLTIVVAPGFYSTGSIVVARGLNYCTSCGIFLDQGSNLCLLHWQVDFLPPSHNGSLALYLKKKNVLVRITEIGTLAYC